MTNYKCIVTMKNGSHKIVRMAKNVMAHVVYEYRKFQQSIFNDTVLLELPADVWLILNNVKSFLFINEWTGEKLEIA